MKLRRSKSGGSSRAIVLAIAALYVWSLLAAFGGFGTGVQSASAEYQYEGKVTICHRTSSGKKPGQTITVPENTVDSHLAHGDTIGPCP